MIRHIVMWKFKDEAQGASKAENLLKAKALLEGCAGIVPGMLALEVAMAQPGLEATYDLILNSAFTDRISLDAYQNHPQHVALKPFLGDVRLERQCMDYEI